MRAILVALVLALAGQAEGLDVTACGTVVPERNVGVLQADLDCSGLPFGVSLQRNARLQLNGHALRGGDRAVSVDFDKGRATIEGPGEVADATHGIVKGTPNLNSRVDVRVVDVEVHDNIVFGIFADRVKLDRVQAHNNRHGVSANFKIRGADVVASDNAGFGIWSQAGIIRLRRVTAEANEWFGVIATQGGGVVLRDSTVLGNAAAFGDVDIASSRRPKLSDVTCGHSSDAFSVFDPDPSTWGVCAND